MGFTPEVSEELLVKADRRCCLCHKHAGQKIEIHHILQPQEGGTDEAENGIPLCFDCHYDVKAYNDSHPRGRKYRPSELRKLRDQWFALVAQGGTAILESPTSSSSSGQRISIEGNNVIAITAGRDLNYNTRKVIRPVFTPGPQHVSPEQARAIGALVDEIVEIEKNSKRPPKNPYGKWWSLLKAHFNVQVWREIPCERGTEAIEWLQRRKAMLRPKLRRTNPEKWRASLYTGIWAKAKELGISHEGVHCIANERLELTRPITSLKELGERNLKKLYDIIFSM